jgi:hypothetical protein
MECHYQRDGSRNALAALHRCDVHASSRLYSGNHRILFMGCVVLIVRAVHAEKRP